MFTPLNHRITRLLAAAIIPASMTFAMAGNALADAAPTPAPVIEPAVELNMLFTGQDLTIEIVSATADYLNCVFIASSSKCPFAAKQIGDSTFQGQFSYGNNVCPITFSIRGDELYVTTLGLNQVVLQRIRV